MAQIGRFVQYHRLNQNISQTSLSRSAAISRSTLSLLERGEKVTLNTLIKVLRVLDLLYVLDVFQVSDKPTPIEYAKMAKKQRRRQRSSGNALNDPNPNEDIGW